MQKSVIYLILVTAMFSAFQARAAFEGSDTELFILCKRYEQIRFLRVQKVEDLPGVKCVTYYNKEGHEKKIGASTSIPTCKSFTDKVLDILKEVAWNCSPVENARVYVISSTPATGTERDPAPERLSESHDTETKQN